MASSPGQGSESAQPQTIKDRSSTDRELLRSLKQLSLATSPGPDPLSLKTPANNKFSSSLNQNSPGSPLAKNAPPPRSPLQKQRSNGFLSQAAQSSSESPKLLRKKSSTSSLHSNSGAGSGRTLSRRSSAQLLSSPSASKPPQAIQPEQEPPKLAPTPVAVAQGYFQKELDALHGPESEHSSETVVILHDACYGHRYSRPKTSKIDLMNIVERPERIQASVLGVSLAYVRLGERHCDGKHPIHPDLDPLSLSKVPFRILKTERRLPINSMAVTNVHGTKWMEELKIMCDAAENRLAVNGKELQRPDIHRGPDAGVPPKLHQGDLYLCSESLNAFEGAMGAVCEAVDAVFSASAHKRAFVAVRPPGHHCSADHPSGFCWVNNVHVGIMHGIINHGLTHTAIIDFDLHHGDGSQAIAWAHNSRGHNANKNASAWKKTSIGYFSLHDINSYPCEWGDEEKVKNASLCIDNAHGQNVWNVHLQEWKSDVEFWKLYQSKYSVLLEKTRSYLRNETARFRSLGQEPKAAIFLSAGFDASEWESDGMQRHKVNVPTEFYARLTRDVVKIASEEGLGVDGRIVSVLEGGYSDRALYSGVLSHLGGLAGNESVIPPSREGTPSGPGWEMGSRLSTYSRRSTLGESDLKPKTPGFPYDPTWWAASELDRFDASMAPSVPETKKAPRSTTNPTYCSPTTASNARMTETAKIRRTISSNLSAAQATFTRAPTPPPPDVPWTAASEGLSKLLIPGHRQVNSYTHQELVAEAAKNRRERLSTQTQYDAASASGDSTASVPSRAPTRMSLRERRPVKPPTPVMAEFVDIDRRKTTGGVVLAADKATPQATPRKSARPQSRRLSSTSTVVPAAAGFPDAPAPETYRPDSSQSNLLASSTSSAPPTSSVPLNMKKTRPPVPARKESARGARATQKKAAGASKIPSVKSEAATGATSASTKGATGTSTAASTSETDMNNLTSGMKRIKINVVTKEMKEARARTLAEKKAKTENEIPPPKAAEISEVSAEAQPEIQVKAEPFLEESHSPLLQDGVAQPPLPSPTPEENEFLSGQQRTSPASDVVISDNAIHNSEDAAYQMELEEARSTVPELMTPVETGAAPFSTSSSSSPAPTPTQADNPDLFVQYQPDGPPASTVPLSGPVQILDPNTNTPGRPQKGPLPFISGTPSPAKVSLFKTSPMKPGHGFTATSAIPFAPKAPQGGEPPSIPHLSYPANATGHPEQGWDQEPEKSTDAPQPWK